MTNLERKIPVEPLDPERVGRLERAVLTSFRELARETRPSRRPLLRPLLVAGAVAAALVGWLVVRPGGGGPAGEGSEEAPVAQRVTTAGDRTRVDLGDAVIVVGPETAIEIRRDAGGIQVALERGLVDCEVAPRAGRPPFVVEAGEVDITVVGTAFRVERGETVRVTVTHGVVRVDAPQGSRAVAAGEAWAGGESVAMAAPVKLPATPAPAAPAAPDLPASDEPQLRERHAVAPPVNQGGPARTGTRTGRRVVKSVPPREPKVDAPPAARAPRVSLAPILDIDGVTEPRALESEYMKIFADSNYSRARQALYSLAWVQLFKLRSRGNAIRSALWFERRFPSGELTEDVLIIRIIASCDGGPSEECRAAAHTYVRRFPSGKYVEQARQITGWDVTR